MNYIVGVNTEKQSLAQVEDALRSLVGVTVNTTLSELGMITISTSNDVDVAKIKALPGVTYVSQDRQVSAL